MLFELAIFDVLRVATLVMAVPAGYVAFRLLCRRRH